MGRGGGLQNWSGGHIKFKPYEKEEGGGLEKVLAMLKRGTTSFVVAFKL